LSLRHALGPFHRASLALRIALAGRSLPRLREVARDLGPAADGWPLLVVDATDEQAVIDLAGRARVVVTTVGPYVKYGVPLAAACAEAGTHYCDLTGEPQFIRAMIDAQVACQAAAPPGSGRHKKRRRTGARVSEIPEALMTAVERLAESVSLSVAALLDDDEAEMVMTRAKRLVRRPVFPIDETGRRHPGPLV